MSTRRLSIRPWRSAAACQRPQQATEEETLSIAGWKWKKPPPTSLQSVCCHQEKWRSVHSHTDKKDVTARWVVLHVKAFVGMGFFFAICQILAAAFNHKRQLRHCCGADPLHFWSQHLLRTCATVEHLPSCFHFLFFCVQKLFFEAGNDVMFLCRCAATNHRNFPLIILSVPLCFPSRPSFAVVITLDCPLWWMWLWLGRCEKP